MADEQRWMQDDAVTLQLSEVHAKLSALSDAPDPMLARRWFVGLCLFRYSPAVRQALESSLEHYRHEVSAGWGPIATWIISLKNQCEDSPPDFPFCLMDQEFDYYATKNFGDKIGNIKAFYKPPSFFLALAGDVAQVSVGVTVTAFLPVLLPEAAGASAFAAPALVRAGGRATIFAAATNFASHVIPGGSWDAARLGRLWPRYMAEYQRRMLS